MNRRVLINANLYGTGGRETHVVKLSEILVGAGTEVTVVSRVVYSSSPIVEALKSIPVKFISTPFASNLQALKLSTLWAMTVWPFSLARASFDALYTLDISPFTPFLRRFLTDGGKTILNRAGDLMRAEDLPAKGIAQPDLIIVETELQAAAVRKLYSNNLSVIAIPSLGHYQHPPERRTSASPEVVNVGFLGRYDENKGAFRLLELWPRLQDHGLSLTFYGYGDRKRLQKSIDACGLSDEVRIEGGWRTERELANILDKLDFVVLPSQSEGLPIILLECMSHGVPYVATDVGAIKTLAEGNPDVLVVANDAESICAGIVQMANGIRSGAVQGKRLQQFSAEKYSYGRVSELWKQVFIDEQQQWTKSTTLTELEKTAEAEVVLDQV